MLGFNSLLRDAGLDPATVKLVRHQDVRAIRGCTPYELWCAKDGRLELYQAIQREERFKGASHIASFVGTPDNDTLFIGIYIVDGKNAVPAGTLDPVRGHDVGGLHLYCLQKSDLLAEYDGRLSIAWGKGRTWVQNAKDQNKPVLEIRRQIGEPRFPGFLDFHTNISALDAVPHSWRVALKAASGVYLLVCLKAGASDAGKPYVGSACGEGGFWARWEEYRQTGHGGNEGMKLDPHTEYHVAILEVAPSSATIGDILILESRWKDKLRSREFGLNKN